jgi:hypothetical protein
MPRKGQFLLHRKDPDFFAFPSLSRGITRENESRFGKIHLTRQRLHLAVTQFSSIGKDGKRITREWRLRENIQLNKFVRAARHERLVHVYLNTRNRTLTSCETSPTYCRNIGILSATGRIRHGEPVRLAQKAFGAALGSMQFE